jgi:hypothetical protein
VLIGNPRHEKNIVDGERAWSDGRVKARAQREIRERYGAPVAVFDDRPGNRRRVARANAPHLRAAGLPEMLEVAVLLPGFTHDPINDRADLRVATFEDRVIAGPDPRREPYLAARYLVPPGGPYQGEFTGIGRNGRGYVLPRFDGRPPGGEASYAALAAQELGSLSAAEFMDAAIASIPSEVQRQLRATLADAREQAHLRLAAEYPDDEHGQTELWRSLACTWLHSRDLTVVMRAIGYPLDATGRHDLCEEVPTEDLLAAVTHRLDEGARYSEWFLRWVARLDRRGLTHIDFLNPNLTVSIWQWQEGSRGPQDAMDAHRVSAHHQGDGADRYDPVEATVNNLLHAREGVYGVQKSPVSTWGELEGAAATHSGAAALAKSDWGGSLIRTLIPVLRDLEATGHVMPWGVVQS